jgi:protein tyrosine/serine phosphatase
VQPPAGKKRKSWGRSIETPRDRFLTKLHFQLADHGILRHLWTNMEEIAPGVWRSNQPGARRLAQWQAMGIRTVLSLRGTPHMSHYLFECESCASLGLTLVTTELHARKPATREALLRLYDLFRKIERPFVMHCKSGADRAGLASALYLLAFRGATVAEAREQLSFRFLHIRASSTGVLDYMLDVYEARLARGAIGIEEWIATEYDPTEIAEGFARLRGGK